MMEMCKKVLALATVCCMLMSVAVAESPATGTDLPATTTDLPATGTDLTEEENASAPVQTLEIRLGTALTRHNKAYNAVIWEAVEGAESYRIERKGRESAEYQCVKVVDEASAMDFTPQGGKVYWYRVVAVTAGGAEIVSNEAAIRTCDPVKVNPDDPDMPSDAPVKTRKEADASTARNDKQAAILPAKQGAFAAQEDAEEDAEQ